MGNITFPSRWYLFEEDSHRPISIILSILFILAFPANILILTRSLLCYCKLNNKYHIFLFGLAVRDLLVIVLYVPLVIDTTVRKEWIKGGSDSQRSTLCEFHGFIYELSISISVAILTILSTSNFVYACKPDVYKKLITQRVVLVVSATIWVCLMRNANISTFVPYNKAEWCVKHLNDDLSFMRHFICVSYYQ